MSNGCFNMSKNFGIVKTAPYLSRFLPLTASAAPEATAQIAAAVIDTAPVFGGCEGSDGVTGTFTAGASALKHTNTLKSSVMFSNVMLFPGRTATISPLTETYQA